MRFLAIKRTIGKKMKIQRRRFLNASGVALALPYLEALSPAHASSFQSAPLRRMVCICAPLGLYTPNFFPTKTGRNYESTPYLEILGDYRSQMTVVSGLSHAGTNPGFAHRRPLVFLPERREQEGLLSAIQYRSISSLQSILEHSRGSPV